jgi:polysaccharide deacetylase 2 family uncharacterized protein YibQ
MVRATLIRRLQVVARRHVWDAACMALFSTALISGAGPLVSGAGKFLDSLTPGAAQASDQPAQVYGPTGDGVARLPMTQLAAASPYSPQVLFPVTSHIFPDWLTHAVRHAAPTPPAPSLARDPVIAICIDDLGEDLAGTDKAMALPKEVAMAFLPYAEATPFLSQEAEGKGHVVLAHVPMEALSHTDPGPMALTVGAPDIAAKIAWNIARVPGLSGINNHEGSRFTEDAPSLAPVMRALAAQHLFFFDSRTGPRSQAIAVAQGLGVTTAGRDIFLDDVVSEDAVRLQLDALAATAKRQGTAIAIGHPHEVTLKVLAGWLSLDHGVRLVTLDEAIKRKRGVEQVALK